MQKGNRVRLTNLAPSISRMGLKVSDMGTIISTIVPTVYLVRFDAPFPFDFDPAVCEEDLELVSYVRNYEVGDMVRLTMLTRASRNIGINKLLEGTIVNHIWDETYFVTLDEVNYTVCFEAYELERITDVRNESSNMES